MYIQATITGRIERHLYSVSQQNGTPLLRLSLSEINATTMKRSGPVEVQFWGSVAEKLAPKLQIDMIVQASGLLGLRFHTNGVPYLGLRGDRCYAIGLGSSVA